MNEVVTIVVNNLLEIVFAVLGASFTALVIPWLKDTGLPWLKEKRLYSIVKKFVEAAEKQAEAGTIDKATKKRFVVELLEANGITVTPEINAFIEAAVKELDLAEKNAIGEIFKSITFDNGTEFAAAEELERSCINKHLPRTKVYFCHPYSSWERGTNENTNGMIRRRFPKGTNFAAVTNAQIVQAENWINNYPRKILGYKSSEIVFRECLRELGIAA